MPSIPQNPLIRVAEVAARELDAAAAAKDFAKHFSGREREAAAKLWGGSAVLLKNGEYAVVQDLEINDFSEDRMKVTETELREERDGVKDLLG